jgi:cytoskeletal protein CcmA (bactofilin family)
MNVNISGSGQIAPGQYDTVKISGSGKLEGLVRCNAFSSSGASRGAELECSGAVKISGSSSFTRGIQAGELSVTGALSCGNDLQVSRELNCSGSLECGGSLRCNSLKLSGEAEVDGDVEAEAVKVSGSLDCTGLLNAETILITGAGMRIGSIGRIRTIGLIFVVEVYLRCSLGNNILARFLLRSKRLKTSFGIRGKE